MRAEQRAENTRMQLAELRQRLLPGLCDDEFEQRCEAMSSDIQAVAASG